MNPGHQIHNPIRPEDIPWLIAGGVLGSAPGNTFLRRDDTNAIIRRDDTNKGIQILKTR